MSVNKEKWGNTVWFLFHTLACKIKHDKFSNNKNVLMEIVTLTCNVLPCPDCSQHATNSLKLVNVDTIKTKEDFILFLFNFHNHVNKLLDKPVFNFNNINKYESANFYIILNNFKIIFSANSNIPQLMSASFHRKHTLPKIIELINSIIPHFE